MAIDQIEKLEWRDSIDLHFSYEASDHRFNFLNKSHAFGNSIDWNYSGFGKLWTYNLNYFDFLQQKKISEQEGLYLIRDYVEKYSELRDGKEPYPTSLRIINWVKYISRHQVVDENINAKLGLDVNRLEHNLEYHLLGNHLLENAFALLFGAYYFRANATYKKASELLREQLSEQVLEDGAHFERTSMYHQLMLFRVLDSIQLLENNAWKQDGLLKFLKSIARKMLGWLDTMTFRNGDIPLINDAAFGINPTTQKLVDYAKKLSIIPEQIALSESGFRAVDTDNYELRLDAGEIGPKYQPGHAHADTFNFILYVRNFPYIVDTGISTYEAGSTRAFERSTAAHNTVTVKDQNSSEVWDSFRVARKASVQIMSESSSHLSASHNGYRKFGVTHRRKWNWDELGILIEDRLEGLSGSGKAFIHFHPDVQILDSRTDFVRTNFGEIRFENSIRVSESEYFYAPEFNKRIKSKMLEIKFDGQLITKINIK